jgi:hypothetical protein
VTLAPCLMDPDFTLLLYLGDIRWIQTDTHGIPYIADTLETESRRLHIRERVAEARSRALYFAHARE